MIKRLEAQIRSVHCIEPVTIAGNIHLKVALLDVDMFELMQSLINEAGIEAILDNISDTAIEDYLKGRDNE